MAGSSDVTVPGGIRCVAVGLALLVVLLVALPVLMVVNPAAFAGSIMRANPSLSPAELDFALTAAIALTAISHAVYAGLAVWFGVMTLKGRRWARIALTILMVAGTLNSLESMRAGPEYFWWAVGGDLIHIAIVGLLWLPTSVREFFAAHRPGTAAS